MAPAKRDAALKEVTNAVKEGSLQSQASAPSALFRQRPGTLATFTRKKRLDQGVLEATDWALAPLKPRDDGIADAAEQSAQGRSRAACHSRTEIASDPKAGHEDAAEAADSPPAPQRRPAARRYPRKIPAPAQQREAEASAQFLATMRAHFQEVDAFELAVETPSPAAPRRRQQSPPTAEAAAAPADERVPAQLVSEAGILQPAHASIPGAEPAATAAPRVQRSSKSSFGLSRRRSSIVSHMPPPHRYSVVGAPEAVLASGAAPRARQPQPPAPRSSLGSRLSIEAGLSRLSLGVASALQRLGLRSSGIGADAQSDAAEEGAHQQLPAVSPIAESPEAQSDCAPGTASPATAATAAPSAQSPAPAPPLAEGVRDAEETFHSLLPLPDLRAPDEDLYASPESQPAASPVANREPLPSPTAPAIDLSYAGEAATVVLPAGVEPAAAQLAAVSLVAPEEEGDLPAVAAAEPPLQQLLRLCGQSMDVEALPSMMELLEEHVDLERITKVGEGTFGEAFKADGVVFKIVPMEGDTPVNGEQQKRAPDILAEVDISLRLSRLRGEPDAPPPANATAGFVQTHGVGVCRGCYAPALTREWHAWDERNGSENDAPEVFPEDQLYIVFVVADGGADLEHFELRSLAEAKSILLQVALTVGVAEEACQFEHRDLHWGNLLIKRGAPATAAFRFRGVDTKVKTGGLAMTLIDFTLSRLTMPSGAAAFCDLSADPELFEGPKGDCQADTYRRMAKLTGGDWAQHCPATNAAWLAYLADAVLSLKATPMSAQEKRQLRAFRKRALASSSCAELVFDEYFEGLWSVK